MEREVKKEDRCVSARIPFYTAASDRSDRADQSEESRIGAYDGLLLSSFSLVASVRLPGCIIYRYSCSREAARPRGKRYSLQMHERDSRFEVSPVFVGGASSTSRKLIEGPRSFVCKWEHFFFLFINSYARITVASTTYLSQFHDPESSREFRIDAKSKSLIGLRFNVKYRWKKGRRILEC